MTDNDKSFRSIIHPAMGPSKPLTRRRLVGSASALAAGLAAAASLPRITFAQDSTPAATPEGTPGAGGTQLVPGQIHYPSGRDGVPDAYTGLPEPFVSSQGTPGTGGSVRALTIAYDPPPPGRDSNTYWQELERRLGVTWEIDIVPQPQYGEVTSARLAGGDLPDIFYINPGQNAPQQYQALEQGAFQDLTPYVTGEALQQFPNLRNIPQYVWDNVKFQGKILGIPSPHTSRYGNVPHYRTDWAETVGMAGAQGPEQMMQLLQAFTTNDPNGNGSPDTWGSGRFEGGWLPWDNTLASSMFRVPHDWRVNPDGTMTYQIETEEYRQAIDFMRQLYAAGAYHPDAANMTFSTAQEAFIGGATGLHSEGFGSFYGTGSVTDRARLVNPTAAVTAMYPIGPDGQPGVVRNTPGYFGYNGIPASITDEDRVMELLRILDYLNSPFGSEEWLFLNYGIEGTHFNRDPETGAPIVTDQLRQDRSALVYLMPPSPTFYYPDEPELALTVMDLAIRHFDIGIDNPALTLYSPTNVSNGPALNQFGVDSINAIITGRSTFEELDAAIAGWRERGGDQIRSEYEEALAQQG